MSDVLEQRILICAPFGKDAALACQVLHTANLDCYPCRTFGLLMQELRRGASAIIVVEEVLQQVRASADLDDYIASQPGWSDLPILVLAQFGSHVTNRQSLEHLGNLMLLDRPLRAATLISAARTALRARQRQYEVRVANQRKDEFLAMLAHELRNPLAPISSAAELMKTGNANNLQLKQTSQVIIRQVRHMTGLIDDLLDVSRVSRGLVKVDRKPQDLKQIVPIAVEQTKPIMEARAHQLVVVMTEETAYVTGDANRLVQILTNLLNNAAKYTQTGGRVECRLEVDNDHVVLHVVDNGTGISKELQPNVFDLFSQAERHADRAQGGLGIGLALVRNLVELHKGTVRCFSEGREKGSTFTVRLPRLHVRIDTSQSAAPVPSPVPSPSPSPSPRGEPLRLMIVDDNVDSAMMLSLILKSSGHDVLVEQAPLSALERARNEVPDVCLLDIGLPDIDGYELARRLRAQSETSATILIAVTGYGQEQDRRNSAASGFDHHLVKPVDLEKLADLLSQISRMPG